MKKQILLSSAVLTLCTSGCLSAENDASVYEPQSEAHAEQSLENEEYKTIV